MREGSLECLEKRIYKIHALIAKQLSAGEAELANRVQVLQGPVIFTFIPLPLGKQWVLLYFPTSRYRLIEAMKSGIGRPL